jgi:hypothetical protein
MSTVCFSSDAAVEDREVANNQLVAFGEKFRMHFERWKDELQSSALNTVGICGNGSQSVSRTNSFRLKNSHSVLSFWC